MNKKVVTRRCLIASMRSFLTVTLSKPPSIQMQMPKAHSIEATILLSSSELIRQKERTRLIHQVRQQQQLLIVPLPQHLLIKDQMQRMIQQSNQRLTHLLNLISRISSRVSLKTKKILVRLVLAILIVQEVMVLMEDTVVVVMVQILQAFINPVEVMVKFQLVVEPVPVRSHLSILVIHQLPLRHQAMMVKLKMKNFLS